MDTEDAHVHINHSCRQCIQCSITIVSCAIIRTPPKKPHHIPFIHVHLCTCIIHTCTCTCIYKASSGSLGHCCCRVTVTRGGMTTWLHHMHNSSWTVLQRPALSQSVCSWAVPSATRAQDPHWTTFLTRTILHKILQQHITLTLHSLMGNYAILLVW